MSVTAPPVTVTTQPMARVHLDYLDGLRALMALLVMFGHIASWTGYRSGLRSFPFNLLLANHFPVDVFIVLSGFCLTLPIARTGVVRGGTAVFFKSRIRRILPPYYAALFLCVGLDILSAHWTHQLAWFPKPAWISHPDPSDTKAFLTYLLLLVDVFPQYRMVDGPLWSVACEFKIYFLFPAVLWLLTRYGRRVALASAAALGYAIMGVWWSSAWPHNHTSCPWFIFLFVMGVCAAEAAFGNPDRTLSKRAWLSLLVVPLVASVMVLFVFHMVPDRAALWVLYPLTDPRIYPFLDPLLGVSTAAALALLSGRIAGVALRPVATVLSWRPLVFLGTFSYSIYLIHMPLQSVLHFFFQRTPVFRDHVQLSMYTLGTALIVGMAYLFFLAFEKPFLTRHKKETFAEVARDAALSPAP